MDRAQPRAGHGAMQARLAAGRFAEYETLDETRKNHLRARPRAPFRRHPRDGRDQRAFARRRGRSDAGGEPAGGKDALHLAVPFGRWRGGAHHRGLRRRHRPAHRPGRGGRADDRRRLPAAGTGDTRAARPPPPARAAAPRHGRDRRRKLVPRPRRTARRPRRHRPLGGFSKASSTASRASTCGATATSSPGRWSPPGARRPAST